MRIVFCAWDLQLSVYILRIFYILERTNKLYWIFHTLHQHYLKKKTLLKDIFTLK